MQQDEAIKREAKRLELANSRLCKRITYLREMTKLTRNELAELTRVSRITYKDWENGRANPAPIRLRYLVDEYEEVGIRTNIEWLRDGVGDLPEKIKTVWRNNSKENKDSDEQQNIDAEAELFCKNHKHSFAFEISDDAMTPIYNVGDVVAGIKYFNEEIAQAVGCDCIVKISNGEIKLRNLQKSKKKDYYNLLCSNPDHEERILSDEQLNYAAPVVWHRKKIS